MSLKINISFPDNSIREFDKGISGFEVAKSIANAAKLEYYGEFANV